MSNHFVAQWSRFTVKQTFTNLRPKRTFTSHFASSEKETSMIRHSRVHDSGSKAYGWEWYEMGFCIDWKPPNCTTVLCLDAPDGMRQALKSKLIDTQFINTTCPSSLFIIVFEEVLILYNNSVWAMRNHISAWEAVSTTHHIQPR